MGPEHPGPLGPPPSPDQAEGLLEAQPHLSGGWCWSCHQEPEKKGVHKHHVFLNVFQDSVCPSLDLELCLSFSVHPVETATFDRVSIKAGVSLSGQNPACLPQEAGKGEPAPTPPHRAAWLPLLSPQCPGPWPWSQPRTPAPPLPCVDLWKRIYFLVKACSSPSTLAWNFTMDSQSHGSSSGVDRKWRKTRS